MLYRDRYVCIARKGHPLRSKHISAKQLCAFDHLLVDPTGRSFWGPVDTVLSGLGRRRRVVTAVPSFHILFELLDAGDFLAFAPERLLHARRSRLRVFDTSLNIPPLEVTATWHPRLNGDARHKWLRETLVRVVGRELAGQPRCRPQWSSAEGQRLPEMLQARTSGSGQNPTNALLIGQEIVSSDTA
jgi:DNA-binding transcriptional LysR family regulator